VLVAAAAVAVLVQLASVEAACTARPTDIDILNFALNLEYLEVSPIPPLHIWCLQCSLPLATTVEPPHCTHTQVSSVPAESHSGSILKRFIKCCTHQWTTWQGNHPSPPSNPTLTPGLRPPAQAEFYSWAAFGKGLPADLRGHGPPSTGGRKAKLSSYAQAYAEVIALVSPPLPEARFPPASVPVCHMLHHPAQALCTPLATHLRLSPVQW
jgi:hypothetical protein